MIEPAFAHKQEVQEVYMKTMYDNRYKYYFFQSYRNFELSIDDSSWNKYQAVSIKDGIVIGYLKASICRDTMNVTSLSLTCFDNKASIAFGADVKRFIRFLFEQGVRKISFKVVIGNPVEKSYDKLVKFMKGRIVGIERKDVKLSDNKYYNVKLYEIFNNHGN